LVFRVGSALALWVVEVHMSRDHRRLRVFQDAHHLAVAVYKHTRNFPKDEWFGIRAQMRRAAVSTPSNIVEGCARRGTKEYLNFLNIARGSAGELSYLVDLAAELGLLGSPVSDLNDRCTSVIPQLERLIRTMEGLYADEQRQKVEERRRITGRESKDNKRKPRAE
jgi:four helix bundle protein